MADKYNFIRLEKAEGLGNLYLDIDEISTFYDVGLKGAVKMKDGTVYDVWENAARISELIQRRLR